MKEFIEKLIGRLEECEERYDDVSFAQLNEFGRTLDYKYAEGKRDGVAESIEIVNKLAEEHESDYCEWNRQDESNFYLHKTSCGTEDTYDDGYVFFPYCGKKIKVVE